MPLREYLSVLKINAVEKPLSGFNFSAPAGSLGVVADVTIPDRSLTFARGNSFDLILKTIGGADPKTNLIKGGKVAGDNKSIGIARGGGNLTPTDSYSLKAVDAIGEKWKLAPRVPVILFNPQFITLEGNETDSDINDVNGNRIVGQTRAVNALDLVYILNFAYVEKCGFTEVITNLPNYQIPRADFSLNSSFHSIAASYYNYFKPVVFEDDGRLFIIDIYGELPAGILSGARTVQASKYLNYSKANPDRAIVNAVLLSHKEVSVQSADSFPLSVTQRVDDDPPNDVGTPGAIGWQRTLFRRYVAEIHDDVDNPAKITSEITWRTEMRTTGRDENGIVRELEINIQTEFYTNSWRLKVGWRREATIYAGNGSGTRLLQQAETETGQIIWKPSIRNPGEWVKERMLSQLEGLVLVEGEAPDTTKTPLRDAERANAIPDDGSASIVRMPISSVTQIWRDTGADQIQILVNKLDHLTNRPESSGTTEHVGTNSVRVRNGDAVNTRQVLLTDATSDIADGPREPISFDAGYIPYAVAKELALRTLDQVRNPKATISCQLASFDGGIRRGSIRRIGDRSGALVTAIVTGYTVTGTQGPRGMLEIGQSIEGVVIG